MAETVIETHARIANVARELAEGAMKTANGFQNKEQAAFYEGKAAGYKTLYWILTGDHLFTEPEKQNLGYTTTGERI